MALRVCVVFLFTAVAGALTGYGQQDFSKVEIKATHVAGNIHMLEGSGGNIGVSVGPDGVLIVDDQFAPLSEKILEAIRKLGGDRPRFILNTHWHGDHVGGNPEFGRHGTIIAHDNERKRLSTRQEIFGRAVEPMAKEGLPVITFDESLSVHFNGEEIRVIHFPTGHTDGDAVVFFPGSNVVHLGDHMFAGAFPFVDLDHGGDVEGFARNVAEVISRLPADVKIIPGHGPLSNLEDLKTFHSMLVETTDVVRRAVAAGKTIDQIKAEGVPAKWQPWGNGFIKTDRWLETIYRSLTAKK
jgi:glyoxylase-like metal-dependent hydrolase (beta-lactamase superfamily II)